ECGFAELERDKELTQHIAECARCGPFADTIRSLEIALRDLPEHDPNEKLVAETVAAVTVPQRHKSAPREFAYRRFAAGLATAAVILAAVGLTQNMLDVVNLDRLPIPFVADKQPEAPSITNAESSGPVGIGSGSFATDQRNEERRDRTQHAQQTEFARGALGDENGIGLSGGREQEESLPPRHGGLAGMAGEAETKTYAAPAQEPDGQFASRIGPDSFKLFRNERSARGNDGLLENLPHDLNLSNSRIAEIREYRAAEVDNFDAPQSDLTAPETAQSEADLKLDITEEVDREEQGSMAGLESIAAQEPTHRQDRSSAEPVRPGTVKSPAFGLPTMEDKDSASTVDISGFLGGSTGPAPADELTMPAKRESEVDRDGREVAQGFLAALRSTQNLEFKEPAGYWANTYVPGDSVLRVLEARLQGLRRTSPPLAEFDRYSLEAAVQPVSQPFDRPSRSALGLYVHADSAAIDGPSRLRVQIGIKAGERYAGQRPAMNVAVVLDLRTPVNAETGARMRALLVALERAQQAGDRFSLLVAGQSGGVVLAPERFRHGPMQAAFTSLFAAQPPASGTGLDVDQALRAAMRQVADVDAVVGGRIVLLVTPTALDADVDTLANSVHHGALAGIMTSVVAVSEHAATPSLDRLVQAGQGRRRVLRSNTDAAATIDDELAMAAKVVAQALRFRIRLAPGVKLIEVIGSRRLDSEAAQRVRVAERSIDRRLAQQLGIKADRGDDDDGIQVVIPTFYAGDTHVILLDVLAEHPGAVADVTVRFKDLIHLRNNVARATLSVALGDRSVGPLQRNVLKNLLAWKVSSAAWQASHFLSRHQPGRARHVLAETKQLLRGLRHEIETWRNDSEMIADETMLGEYVTVLNTPPLTEVGHLYLAESLQVAAVRKLKPIQEH
ncbi:MAG: hypothetical protein OEQ39_07520, partial [Gammaproteobacteria bacterium]|nr:hypothetical protein [Gammaproteobacteria bacterium]